MSDTATTRQVVEDYYAALRINDRARLLELLDPDCTFTPPESAPVEPLRGGEAIALALGAKIVKETFDLTKPFNLEVRRMVADGAVAVVQQRLQATAKATGLPYDNQYCWVYEVRDGRIVSMEEYADTMVAAKAMGWGG
ncbi:MAG: nuclear transport factor 2 family protein [Acidimicrobiales bacterium]